MEQPGQIITSTTVRDDGPNVTGETVSTKRAPEVGNTNDLDLFNFPALTSNINNRKSPRRNYGGPPLTPKTKEVVSKLPNELAILECERGKQTA